MRILMVGAGAVGQVYGAALASGGEHVSVFVRPKHVAEAKKGFRMTRIPVLRRRTAAAFIPAEVLTTAEEIGRLRPDQLWLCVATDALDGTWLDEVLAASGNATIVCLQPGMSVRQRLVGLVAEERIVWGVIGLLSFHAPMDGSTHPRELATPEGIAFFYPPASPTRVSGLAERRLLAVRDGLRRGGCPVESVADARVELVFGSAILLPQMAALELAGWTFQGYRDSSSPELGARASREALSVAAAEIQRDAPPAASLVLPPFLRLGTRIAAWVAPLDVEGFLRAHFIKVGAQTRLLIEQWSQAADRLGLPHEGLTELSDALRALDEGDEDDESSDVAGAA